MDCLSIRLFRKPFNLATIIFISSAIFFLLVINGCGTGLVSSIEDERISYSLSHSDYVRVEYEEQLMDYGCGLAALVSILGYWDIQADQGNLSKLYPPETIQEGYTFGELKTIARNQGLKGFAIEGDLISLKGHLLKGRPVIVPITVDSDYIVERRLPFVGAISRSITRMLTSSYHHYVVVFGFGKNLIWLMDPVVGINSVDMSQFLKMWSKEGRAMLLVSR